MASDLGAWPAEQASVLLEVLQREGLSPEAKRTREGIHVVVPDQQSDQAHQVLAANMDVIARAARPAGHGGSVRRARRRGDTPARPPTAGPRRGSTRGRRGGDAGERRLTSERLVGAAPAIALLIVLLLVAAIVPQAAFFLLVVGAFAGVWYLGKRGQRDGDD